MSLRGPWRTVLFSLAFIAPATLLIGDDDHVNRKRALAMLTLAVYSGNAPDERLGFDALGQFFDSGAR